MEWESRSRPTKRQQATPTVDELVRHLREAGAKRVYLSWDDAFRDGTVPLLATYAFASEETRRTADPDRVREMLTDVFEATTDNLRFHNREWALEWRVEPAFAESRTDLLPLYDRKMERKYGDGFNLRNLRFAYEMYHERQADS